MEPLPGADSVNLECGHEACTLLYYTSSGQQHLGGANSLVNKDTQQDSGAAPTDNNTFQGGKVEGHLC